MYGESFLQAYRRGDMRPDEHEFCSRSRPEYVIPNRPLVTVAKWFRQPVCDGVELWFLRVDWSTPVFGHTAIYCEEECR